MDLQSWQFYFYYPLPGPPLPYILVTALYLTSPLLYVDVCDRKLMKFKNTFSREIYIRYIIDNEVNCNECATQLQFSVSRLLKYSSRCSGYSVTVFGVRATPLQFSVFGRFIVVTCKVLAEVGRMALDENIILLQNFIFCQLTILFGTRVEC